MDSDLFSRFPAMISPCRDQRNKCQKHQYRARQEKRIRRKIFRESVFIYEFTTFLDYRIGDQWRYDHRDQYKKQYPDPLELPSRILRIKRLAPCGDRLKEDHVTCAKQQNTNKQYRIEQALGIDIIRSYEQSHDADAKTVQ